MILLSFISGALFRRWWGGWLSPNGTVKRIVGLLLPLVVGYYVFGLHWLTAAYAALIMLAWLMPFHGYGISMGADLAKPRWKCLVVMGLQYGLITAIVGALWYFGYGGLGGLFYAPLGATVALGYLVPRLIWPDGFNGNSFIDSPTAISELWLGGILIGGLPLCSTLTKLV